MANNKVQLANGTVLIDLTDTTATASDVLSGEYFYDAAGVKTEGSLSLPSTYTVTKTLTNVTTTNDDTEVLTGGSFYMDLVPEAGYKINSIIVTMGGVDVTDQVFKAGVGQKIITQNGSYDAEDDYFSGYSSVNVNVPNSYTLSDEGKVVSNGSLVSQTSATYTLNDTYDTTLKNSVTVNVANSYSASDEGKVVSNGALVSQTSATYTSNNTYDTTTISSVTVNVSGGGITPTGTYTITSSGTYDITNYAYVEVDIDMWTEQTISTTGAVSQTLSPFVIYHFTGAITSLTITLDTPASGQLAHYHFDFLSGSTAATLSMPQTVEMPDNFVVESNNRYEIDILNNYGTVTAWQTS